MKFADGAIIMRHGGSYYNFPADRVHIQTRSLEGFKINGGDREDSDRNIITFESEGVQFFVREQFVRLLSDMYQAFRQSRDHDREAEDAYVAKIEEEYERELDDRTSAHEEMLDAQGIGL